jgi:hypothetical protein
MDEVPVGAGSVSDGSWDLGGVSFWSANFWVGVVD